MSASEAAPTLDRAVAAGVLSRDERDLLARIMAGEAIAEILRDKPALRRIIRGEHGGEVESFVGDVSDRMANFVKGEPLPDRKRV
jgi:hypothetical protein